jgi:hypothetical protein
MNADPPGLGEAPDPLAHGAEQLTQLKLEMTQLKSKLEARNAANVKHLNAAHKEVRRLKSVLEKRHLDEVAPLAPADGASTRGNFILAMAREDMTPVCLQTTMLLWWAI